MNKKCATCKESKPLEHFHKNKYNKDGYQYRCALCCSLHYSKIKEVAISRSRKWYVKNKDKKQQYDKERRILVGEKLRKYDRERSVLPQRRAQANRTTAKRRIMLRQALPKWETELTELVLIEAYSVAKQREKTTGIKWHVDHIVPVQGEMVCGLHVWNNIQVLSAVDNIRKSNHYERNV